MAPTSSWLKEEVMVAKQRRLVLDPEVLTGTEYLQIRSQTRIQMKTQFEQYAYAYGYSSQHLASRSLVRTCVHAVDNKS